MVLLRQILAIFENSRLNNRLEGAYQELEGQNQILQKMVFIDSMTGLANHGAFQERLREELSRSSRSARPVSVMLIDVDYFKQYNDAFGHPSGDAVLKEVSRVLRSMVRDEDVVARYGGEEFAIILPEAAIEGAEITADRIRVAVAEAPLPSRSVTVSIGVATSDGHN